MSSLEQYQGHLPDLANRRVVADLRMAALLQHPLVERQRPPTCFIEKPRQ